MRALGVLHTDDERREFLAALLSPSEVAKINRRWEALRILMEGKTHRVARDEVRISIATVSRAARQIQANSSIIRTVNDRIMKVANDG